VVVDIWLYSPVINSSSTLAMMALDNPFFTVSGLPVHTLVVHFAVVMLPLSAIALVAIILVPRWRGAFVWAAMIGLLIGTGAAFVSMESGQALSEVVGVPAKHSKWGEVLPWVGLLLLITAVLWVWLNKRAGKAEPQPAISMGSGAQLAVGVIAIGLSIIATGMTIVVGHTGAEAVWSSRSLDSEAEEDAPVTPTPSTTAAAGSGYTMADVAAHSTAADCWSVVSGNVYDLTKWIPQHPGGAGVIEGMCGVDGTAAFEGQHRGDKNADAALAGFLLGPLGGGAAVQQPSAVPQPSAAPATSAAATAAAGYTAADVKAHATPADCWSIVTGNVYDLTQWIPQHPGGPGVIEGMCGVDGTAAFEGQHKGSGSANAALAGFLLGPLGGPAAPASAAAAASAGASGYTMADVAAHAKPADCWSVVNSDVYDLTQWIPQHPGGPGVIEGMCGVDGTAAFDSQHKGDGEVNGILATFKIGALQ
jgi:cytochrome b involved in lipid metabolism